MTILETIDERREDLERACLEYRVDRLELFGSAVRSDFDEQMSDLDLLVEFLPGPVEEAASRYFGLLERLEEMFDRPVDLVMPSSVRNPYLKQEIESSRVLLYAA